MKFRAFTASRISDGDLLKKINSALVTNTEEGGTLSDFLKLTNDDLLDEVGMGPGSGAYWENVYRTNVQTAYNTGRAIGFEEVPPLALEMIVIDDSRTSPYCRPFAGKRIILPYDDPFWQTHWPPLHFQCRTTVRGIYDEDELPDTYVRPDDAGAADGFGGYPLSNDSWWQELDSQIQRASEYGIQPEIEKAAKLLHIVFDQTSGAATVETATKDTNILGEAVEKNNKSAIFNIDDEQFGRKAGRHAADFGLTASQEADRRALKEIIFDIVHNADEVRTGRWRGYAGPVVFYIKDDDVVVSTESGNFITVLKGGINNARVKDAGRS